MLLPSALPCEARHPQTTASYFPPFRLLSPPPSHPTSPITSNILTTCCALQSFLTADPVTPISAPTRLLSPIELAPPKLTTAHRAKAVKAQRPVLPQRVRNKRRRDADDDGEREMTKREKLSTPKRVRACPPSLPLGLERADFDALQPSSPVLTPSPPPTTRPQPQLQQREFSFRIPPPPSPRLPSPHHPSPSHHTFSPPSHQTLSTEEEEALITLLFSKLRLRRSDWDACAARLGSGRDSIGERWRLLVSEGDVGGLRRGGRRGMVRGRVDGVEGWMRCWGEGF